LIINPYLGGESNVQRSCIIYPDFRFPNSNLRLSFSETTQEETTWNTFLKIYTGSIHLELWTTPYFCNAGNHTSKQKREFDLASFLFTLTAEPSATTTLLWGDSRHLSINTQLCQVWTVLFLVTGLEYWIPGPATEQVCLYVLDSLKSGPCPISISKVRI
jgi:hypothetical protein